MAVSYIMQARDSVTGDLHTWLSGAPDFSGADYDGPGTPSDVAVAGTGGAALGGGIAPLVLTGGRALTVDDWQGTDPARVPLTVILGEGCTYVSLPSDAARVAGCRVQLVRGSTSTSPCSVSGGTVDGAALALGMSTSGTQIETVALLCVDGTKWTYDGAQRDGSIPHRTTKQYGAYELPVTPQLHAHSASVADAGTLIISGSSTASDRWYEYTLKVVARGLTSGTITRTVWRAFVKNVGGTYEFVGDPEELESNGAGLSVAATWLGAMPKFTITQATGEACAVRSYLGWASEDLP